MLYVYEGNNKMNSHFPETIMARHASSILIAFILFSAIAFSQNRTTIMKRDTTSAHGAGTTSKELLHIPELSAMIAEANGKLTVDHVLELAMRAKGYEKTDVKEGDVLLMANGKKLGGLPELKELYNSAPIGSTVKVGIKRNEEMLIASFTKADPKSMPHMRMMISRGEDEDFLGIPQIGLRFASSGKDVVVKEVLPNASTELPDVDVKEGDIVSMLDGNPVKTFKGFTSAYGKLHAGDHVELVTVRAGKSHTIVFSKPKDDGRVVIRRQGRK